MEGLIFGILRYPISELNYINFRGFNVISIENFKFYSKSNKM